LGKKSLKKSRFNITTSVDTYKNEFINNSKITLLSNVLSFQNLNATSNNVATNYSFDNKALIFNSLNLLGSFLKLDKSNFIEAGKTQFFKNDLLFVNTTEDRIFKQNTFRKNQILTGKKKTPILVDSKYLNVRLWSVTNNTTISNFFQEELLNVNLNNNLIQHPDLDDETRTIKRNAGKTTPIRVLKHPNTDFFFINNNDNNNIELLRFRFNEKKPTLANKPIRPTLYLTFKQKRYNQRTNISKKTTVFFDKDLNKQQIYSGNPFLKDLSIVEENYGNPTRQYRMLKKAKNRVDNTRVGT
jgi:hypothetical protein